MAINQSGKQFYEFGPFCVDARERLLLREGQAVPLTPKAFDTLLVLVQNRGRVLEKDELMRAIWPDSFVEEVNLAHHISVLRRILEDVGSEQRYIETVPRRGYRFAANVRQFSGEEVELLVKERTKSQVVITESEEICDPEEAQVSVGTAQGAPEAKQGLIPRALVVCGIVVGLGVSLFYLWISDRQRESPPSVVRSIAVLPFKPVVAGSRDESLELGMADSLITKLSNLRQIVVRPTGAVRKYTSLEQDPLTAGLELKVDSVLDGSIQKSGERIRVTARLFRVQDGSALWAAQFDEKFTDIFTVQDSISQRVTSALALKLTSEERGLLARRYTRNAEAYQLYIKGRYFWNQRTEASLRKAIEYFEQAIEKDPAYAAAYSGLADSYTTLGYFSYLAPNDSFPKAKQAASKALELDHTLAEPHTSLAYASLYFDWNWPGAEMEFKEAIALNPNYATAHHWYSVYLTAMERWEEASLEIRRAQDLDPLSLIINTDIGFELYYSGRYDQAIRQLKTVLEMNRQFPLAHLWLGRAYQQKAMYQEASVEFKEAETVLHGWPVALAALGHVYGASGQRRQAEIVLLELNKLSKEKYVTSYGMALIYAGLGEKDQAFGWLNKAYEERTHWLVWLKLDPRWENLRSDPRFAHLVQRIGLVL